MVRKLDEKEKEGKENILTRRYRIGTRCWLERGGQKHRNGGGGRHRVGVNSHSSSLHGVEMILLTPAL